MKRGVLIPFNSSVPRLPAFKKESEQPFIKPGEINYLERKINQSSFKSTVPRFDWVVEDPKDFIYQPPKWDINTFNVYFKRKENLKR